MFGIIEKIADGFGWIASGYRDEAYLFVLPESPKFSVGDRVKFNTVLIAADVQPDTSTPSRQNHIQDPLSHSSL
jgi:hypothetical protein